MGRVEVARAIRRAIVKARREGRPMYLEAGGERVVVPPALLTILYQACDVVGFGSEPMVVAIRHGEDDWGDDA